MPVTFANRGKFQLTTTAVSGTTDVRCLVITTAVTPTVAQIQDFNFVSDLLAVATEAANAGYARVDLAGFTVTENDTNDRVDFTATAPTLTSVASGGAWLGVGYYIEGASDAARVLLAVDIPAATFTPNGGDVTLPQLVWTLS